MHKNYKTSNTENILHTEYNVNLTNQHNKLCQEFYILAVRDIVYLNVCCEFAVVKLAIK